MESEDPLLTPQPRPSTRRRTVKKRQPHRWRWRLAAAAVLAIALLLGWAVLARRLAPRSNTAREHFDAIIVFGCPASATGGPSPCELARLGEAVHEYRRGVAPRLILTGGAAHNSFVESRVMAAAARAEGLPDSVLYLDIESMDTIQNAKNALRILQSHGWSSAELISSPQHMPRIGLIFENLPVEWRLHTAPPLEPESKLKTSLLSASETLKTLHFLLCTPRHEMEKP